MNLIKQIFCKHNYKQISWREKLDTYKNERYCLRLYKCQKCGKEIWVDGRADPIIHRY